MTATSGPGFSLMQEGIGYAAMTETPCVIVNVQRMGPSSGFATAPAQADVMQAKYGTHGPHPTIALAPSSVKECFDVTVKAFNLAERYRTPVIILTDAVIGHLREVITLPDASELTIVDRERPKGPPGTVKPFYTEGDIGIPAIPDFGTGYRFHITGLFHDETGFPATSPAKLQHETERLVNKVEARADEMAHVEYFQMDDAEVTVVSCGCSARSAKAAVRAARAQGHQGRHGPADHPLAAAGANTAGRRPADPQAGGGRDEPGRAGRRDPAHHPQRREGGPGQPPRRAAPHARGR